MNQNIFAINIAAVIFFFFFLTFVIRFCASLCACVCSGSGSMKVLTVSI